MELLSKNLERYHYDVNLEMPQLVGHNHKVSPAQIAFANISTPVFSTQVNFSTEEEEVLGEIQKEIIAEEAIDPTRPNVTGGLIAPEMEEAAEEEFVENLVNGQYVDQLERAVGDRPMNVFNKEQHMQDTAIAAEMSPDSFVEIENIPATKTDISGPRPVVPLAPGTAVAGINHAPVVNPVEALPETKVEEKLTTLPVYGENKVVAQDTSVQDPVSIQGATPSIIDKLEEQRQGEMELYKSFMESVM